MSRHFSRRSLLQHAAAAGAAGAIPATVLAQGRTPYRNLSATEGATLDAIVARLIPSDANGPGAAEAGAATYIDRALGGWLAASLPAYREGLAATDALARRRYGQPFGALAAADQDTILLLIEQATGESAIDREAAPGGAVESAADITAFPGSPASFFDMVLEHTIQGTFCDPVYGGNRDFVGWAMLGYPGIRLAVSAEDQAMDATPAPTGISAYDLPMFDAPGEGQ